MDGMRKMKETIIELLKEKKKRKRVCHNNILGEYR